MRDEPRFVEQLHRDLRDVRWPEPAEIRARARRRSRRTSVLAAVAVLVVASGSAYAVNGRPVPPAPPAAVTAGSPVDRRAGEIPQEAMLAPADVPAEDRRAARRDGPRWSRSGSTTVPAGLRPGTGRAVGGAHSRYSRSQTLLGPREPADDRRPGLTQDVYRLDPGGGPVGLRPGRAAARRLRASGGSTGPRSWAASRWPHAEVVHRWDDAVERLRRRPVACCCATRGRPADGQRARGRPRARRSRSPWWCGSATW